MWFCNVTVLSSICRRSVRGSIQVCGKRCHHTSVWHVTMSLDCFRRLLRNVMYTYNIFITFVSTFLDTRRRIELVERGGRGGDRGGDIGGEEGGRSFMM